LYFKPFPRSAVCNPVLQHDAGPKACDAAFAAECAGQQGKFWEMTTILFANMNYLDPVSIEFMAEQVGVDVGKFQQCLDDPNTSKGIEADARAGAEAGVIGTPAFFLHGTHGDKYIEMTQGAFSALRLVEAHLDGVTLPPPGPPIQHPH
jgi:protein-disulfide isomerase